MPRRLLLLLLAIVISGGTVYLAQHWMHNQLATRQTDEPALVQAHPLVQVLVAKSDIPAGSFLRPESLRWQLRRALPLDAGRTDHGRTGGSSRRPRLHGGGAHSRQPRRDGQCDG